MRDNTADYYESSEFQQILQKFEEMIDNGSTLYLDASDIADIVDYYVLSSEQEKVETVALGAGHRIGTTSAIPYLLLVQGRILEYFAYFSVSFYKLRHSIITESKKLSILKRIFRSHSSF